MGCKQDVPSPNTPVEPRLLVREHQGESRRAAAGSTFQVCI